MYIEGLTAALFVFSLWCWQRDTSKHLADIDAALRPPDPAVEAEARRKARLWEAHCAAERARLADIAGADGYDAYLAPLRAKIAAQNQR